MMKRFFGAFALLCVLAQVAPVSLKGQNTTTFGNIVSQGVPCGSSNCVYYQLPPNTQWVTVTVTGTWVGTVETAVTNSPNANYSNLSSLTWTPESTNTANGTWTAWTLGSTYLRVRATSWSSGLAHVAMDSTLSSVAPVNPVFPGQVTVSGVTAISGGSPTTFFATDGSIQAGGGIPSLNAQTGAQTLVGSGTVTVTPNGSNQIVIAGTGGGGSASGVTGNGIALSNANQAAPATTVNNVTQSPVQIWCFGNSICARDATTIGDLASIAVPGGALQGLTFLKVVSGGTNWSCNAGSNLLTLPVANAHLYLQVGWFVSFGGTASVTGNMWDQGVPSYDGPNVITAITTGSPDTITVTNSGCSGTGGTTILSGTYVTPNYVKCGVGGATLEVMNAGPFPACLTQMATAKSQGFTLAIEYREGLINSVRQDVDNYATVYTLETGTGGTLPMFYAAFPGIPIIFEGEPSIGSDPNQTQYVCPAGTAASAGCTAGLTAATLGAGISAGTNTVTLTNSTGVTFAPPSIWAGPGTPLVTTLEGVPMQVVLDTSGSGVQETVTVTAITATITDSTHYTVTLTFTNANAHSSGAPVIATQLWAGQSYSSLLESIVQAMPALQATYPSLQVTDTQQLYYGLQSWSTKPGDMLDNLHPVHKESFNLAAKIASYTNFQPQLNPEPDFYQDFIGANLQAANTSALTETIAHTPSWDPAFSPILASNMRESLGYWEPGPAPASGITGYPLWCEDADYLKVVLSGRTASAYTAGTTGSNVLPLSLSTAAQDVRGSSSLYTWVDIVDVIGQGCYPQVITSGAANGTTTYEISLGGSGIPINVASNTPVAIVRYLMYDATAVAYLRAPTVYTKQGDGYLTSSGGNYQVNYSLPSGAPKKAPYSSVTGGWIVTFATAPLLNVTLDYSNLGAGNYVNGDVVTVACQATNATVTLSVQNGYPYAAAVTTIGAGCMNSTVSQAVTGGSGTGLKLMTTAGTETLPTVAGQVLSTQVGTGSPTGYAVNDTVTSTCGTTNATWTVGAVSSGAPLYLKPGNKGVGCTAETNGATTTSGSGTGLTVTTTVSVATSCSLVLDTSNFLTCTDTSGLGGGLYNNLGMNMWSATAPDIVGSNITGQQHCVPDTTNSSVKTCLVGAAGATADHLVTLQPTTGTLQPVTTNALTSYAGGSGTTSVTCTGATNMSGTCVIVGGTFTTGTAATLVWPTTGTAYRCWATQNGGTTVYGVGHGTATATGMTLTVANTIAGATVTIDYGCSAQ